MKKPALLLIITFLILKSFSNDLQDSFMNEDIKIGCEMEFSDKPIVDFMCINPFINFYKRIISDNENGSSNIKINKLEMYELGPTATITSTDQNICNGETATIEITLTGKGPWDLSYFDGTKVTTINSITLSNFVLKVNPSASTAYSITGVKDQNATNTAVSSVVWVNVSPRPVFIRTIHATDLKSAIQDIVIDQVCVGAKCLYRVEGEQGAIYTWELHNSSGVKINLSNLGGRNFQEIEANGDTHYMNELEIDWKIAGVYKLTVIQQSLNKCDMTDQGFVEVFDQPTVVAGNPLRICADKKLYLTSASANHYGSLFWTTSGDGLFDDPTALQTVYNSGPNDLIAGKVDLTLTAYGKGGTTSCTPASSTLTSTFLIIPKLVITDPVPVCAPATIDLSVASITQGSDPDVGNFEYFTDLMATIPLVNYKMVDKAGIYYIRGTNATGCSVIQAVIVKFSKLIVPNFASIGDVCLNSVQQLPTSNFNGISGHWEPSANIKTDTEGQFNYTFKVDPGQCAKDTTIAVKVTKSVSPTFAFNTTFCLYEITAPLPTFSGNGLTGTWDKPLSTSSIGEEIYTFTPDGNTCGVPVQIKIMVNQPASPPMFNFPKELCQGSTPFALPLWSVEGVNGTWEPAIVETNQLGVKNYIFTPSAGQCVQYRVEQIWIIHAITPVFNPIGPLCNGSLPQTLPLTSANGISGTWAPATIATNNSGPFTYIFTPDDDDDCAIPVTMTIEIYNQITVDVKYDPITVLGGKTTVTVSASGGSGTFTSGTGQIELGSGNHDFTVTDNANCAGTKTIYISEPQQFDVEAKILTAAPCFGGIAQIQAIASGGTAPYSYRVFRDNQLFLTGAVNQNTFYVPGSTLPYHFEVVDANGQFARSNILDVTNPPKIELTASSTETTCAGMNDGTATVVAKFGQAPYKYLWNNGQTTQTATGLSVGNHRVEVWDQLYCYRVSIDVVVADPSVKTLQASATNPKCHGENGTILFTFTNVPDGLYDILYDTGNKFTAVQITNNSASVSTPAGEYNNLKLVINGCSTASGVNATVNQTLALTINTDKVIKLQPSCQIPQGTIIVQEPAQNSGYLYSKDNGTSYQASSTFAFLNPETYQLRIKNILTGCESDPLQVVINQAPNTPVSPVSSITPPTCTTATGTITVIAPAPGIGVSFTVRGINPVKAPISNSTGVFLGQTPGDYEVTTTNANGCASAPISLTIDAQPITPAFPDATVAEQPTCELSTGTIAVNNPTPGSTYTLRGTNPVRPAVTNSSGVFSGLAMGVYSVITTTAATCVSGAKILTVNDLPAPPANPVLRVSATPECSDPTGELTVDSPTGPDWEYSKDGITFQASPVFGQLVTNIYTITVRNTKTKCTSSAIKGVPPIPPAPALSLVSFKNPECFGDAFTINLSMTTTIPPGNYTFWYDGGQFDNIPVANNKATISGVITEKVKQFNNLRFVANGCTSTGATDVTIESPEKLEIRIVKVLEQSLIGTQKGAIDIAVSGGTGKYKFNWSNGATTEDLDDVVFGNYTSMVSDDKNCTALTEIRVPLNNPPVALADIFTFICSSVIGNLIENDYDGDGDFMTINTIPVKKPTFAQEFIIYPDGTFSYKAISGYSGTDYFIYEIADNLGQTAIATVTLIIVSDFDSDMIRDSYDPDADGDGILNIYEALAGQDWRPADADGDGLPNYLDNDSDNDGVVDNIEAQLSLPRYILPSNLDVNKNGVDDAYDTYQFTPELKPIDTDNDGFPDFLDIDSDNDGVPDYIEVHDGDSNGRADITATGKDSDSDGLDDAFDTAVNDCNVLGNAIGNNSIRQDTDSDGIPDWRDDNDDNDLYLTKYEDLNADGDFSKDDVDFDGIPEYLDFRQFPNSTENLTENEIQAFPNPTTGIVNIEISNGTDKDIEISVTNLLGVEVFRKEMTHASKFSIDLSNQINGIYLLKVINDNQQSISKIVLRKE